MQCEAVSKTAGIEADGINTKLGEPHFLTFSMFPQNQNFNDQINLVWGLMIRKQISRTFSYSGKRGILVVKVVRFPKKDKSIAFFAFKGRWTKNKPSV